MLAILDAEKLRNPRVQPPGGMSKFEAWDERIAGWASGCESPMV